MRRDAEKTLVDWYKKKVGAGHFNMKVKCNQCAGTGEIRLESGIPYETIRGLMDRKHKVSFGRGIYGGYQAIMWDKENKVYRGASESRKDGQAAGF